MKDSRKRARRASSRAFRPGLDGRLEERFLLTRTVKLIHVASGLLKHTKPRAAFNVNQPPFLAHDAPVFNRGRGFKPIKAVGIQTARGGQNVELTATDGSHYMSLPSITRRTPLRRTSRRGHYRPDQGKLVGRRATALTAHAGP